MIDFSKKIFSILAPDCAAGESIFKSVSTFLKVFFELKLHNEAAGPAGELSSQLIEMRLNEQTDKFNRAVRKVQTFS